MSESDDIVERMARAIWAQRENSLSARMRRKSDDMEGAAWQSCLSEAIAALQAIRAPTVAMVMATGLPSSEVTPIWTAMVDAALGE